MDLRVLIFMPALVGAAICAFLFFTFAAHYYLTVLESTAAGAREVYACATHAVLCGPAIEKLRDAPLRQIVVTDTIPVPPGKHLPNLTVLSVAKLLADAIKRIHTNESVSKLFE